MPDSRYYSKFLNQIYDRLDESYNDPCYEEIDELLKMARFRVVQLGDEKYLENITSGKTPRGIHYLAENGIPFLGATQVSNGRVYVEDAPHIREELHRTSLKGSQIEKGDVLLTIAGYYIGRCGVFTTDEECNCNQAIAMLRLNQEKIIPEFLARYLNSNIGQLFFGKFKHISGQPNINTTEIGKIKIILPKREEQEKILRCVTEKESALAHIGLEIEELREKKSGLILEEFGLSDWKDKMGAYFFRTGKSDESIYFALDFRDLEDRLNHLFYDPRQKLLKEVMEKYSTTNLANVLMKPVVRGIQPDYVEESGVMVIKTVDLKDDYIDYENCLRTSEESFDKFPDAHVKENDVLVASTGYISVGKVDVYDLDEMAIADGHVSILRLKQGYDPQFVAHFLRSHLGKIQFEKWWSGSSGQIEIQPSDLEKFIVPSNTKDGVPFSEQENISKQLSRLSARIRKLRLKQEEIENETRDLFESFLYWDQGAQEHLS